MQISDNVFKPGFGDLDETTGEISDIVVTNNNSHKVRLCEVSDFEVLCKWFSTIDYATQYPIATCISGNLMRHSFTALPVYTNNRSYKYVADRSGECQTKIIGWENHPHFIQLIYQLIPLLSDKE